MKPFTDFLARPFLDFSVRWSRSFRPDEAFLTLYHNRRPVQQVVKVPLTIESARFPDVFCMLMKNYEKEFLKPRNFHERMILLRWHKRPKPLFRRRQLGQARYGVETIFPG